MGKDVTFAYEVAHLHYNCYDYYLQIEAWSTLYAVAWLDNLARSQQIRLPSDLFFGNLHFLLTDKILT